MQNKFAKTRRRDAKVIDDISVASNLDSMLAFTYTWHAEKAKTFKQVRMYVPVLINKLEKESPQPRPYFSLT